MNNNWWAEWFYESDELEGLTDSSQREAGHCFIGSEGIYWPSDPPLFTKFGRLTDVKIVPGNPKALRLRWEEKKEEKGYGSGPAPIGAPGWIVLLNLFTFATNRLLAEQGQLMGITLPIPKRHVVEAEALAEQFRVFINSGAGQKPVQKIGSLLTIGTMILIILLVVSIVFASIILKGH